MTKEEILNAEQRCLDDIRSRLGERFKDYLILARRWDGRLSWRSSDPLWSESAARTYILDAETYRHMQRLEDLQRGD